MDSAAHARPLWQIVALPITHPDAALLVEDV
jgi:hypothetical protein